MPPLRRLVEAILFGLVLGIIVILLAVALGMSASEALIRYGILVSVLFVAFYLVTARGRP